MAECETVVVKCPVCDGNPTGEMAINKSEYDANPENYQLVGEEPKQDNPPAGDNPGGEESNTEVNTPLGGGDANTTTLGGNDVTAQTNDGASQEQTSGDEDRPGKKKKNR